MGRFGFHSGSVKSKNVQINNKFVQNRKVVLPEEMNITGLNKTGASLTTFGESSQLTTYSFGEVADSAVGYREVIPDSVVEKTGIDVTLYWTCSGVLVDSTGVVWDLEYRVTDVLTSGISVGGLEYGISGAFTNVTATTIYPLYDGVLSGSITTTKLSIPKAAVRTDSIIQMVVFRDVGESADTRNGSVHLIAMEIAYVDA